MIATRSDHLSPAECVDLVDGVLPETRSAHAATCDVCRTVLGELRLVVDVARTDSVPEPSPLFWDHFSERVTRSVHNQQPPVRGWGSVLAMRSLVPVGAVTLVVVGLSVGMFLRGSGGAGSATGVSPAVLPSSAAGAATRGGPAAGSVPGADAVSADDESWTLVRTLTATLDFDQMKDTSFDPALGAAEVAADQLSEAERLELVRLLKAEVGRPLSPSPE
jgi:hypothetical protein